MKKFLILCCSGLGNIVMFLPSYHLLRQHFDGAEFTIVLDDRWFHDPFFIDQFGNVDIIYTPLHFKRKPFKFIRSLLEMRSYKADIALMPYSGASWRLGILLLLTSARRVVYFQTGKMWLDKLFNPCLPVVEGEHYIERNFRQIRALGIKDDVIKAPSRWIKVRSSIVKELLGKKDKMWIGVHAGVNKEFNSARQWPIEYFREIVRRLVTEWDALPILFGKGKDEVEDMNYIARGFETRVRLVLNRSLREVAAYISLCDMFLGNDSGLMNLSVGLGTPTIAILGPTDPRHTGPYGSLHKVVRLNLPCSPCFDKGFSLKCPHRKCLTALTPDIVWDAMLKMRDKIGK